MALKFNPKTGEWDEVADAPSDPVARIGVYFKGFYSSKLDDSASWLVFVGYAIVLLAVFSISTILGIVLLIGLFFEKTRNVEMVVGWIVGFPIAYLLSWVFYNKWTLICSAVLAIGFML